MLAIQNKMTVLKSQDLGKQRGISVLEVMLSLAIIAVILVMATRYYKTAQQSQQVKNALNILGGIVSAEVDYAATNSNAYDLNIEDLSTKGYLPPGIGGSGTTPGNDPWGNKILLGPGANGGFMITFSSVPSNACQELANIVNQQQAGTAPDCSSGAYSSFSATYE